MISRCPACNKEVEHEDFLFEVICSCGSRFNPFMNMTEAPPLDGVAPAAPTWQEPPAAAGFSESQSAFQEIKAFGEGSMMDSPAPPKAPTHPTSALAAEIRSETKISDGSMILTAGDGIPGYRIESYLAPVSAAAELDPAHTNPMHRGFSALEAQAHSEGANGIVAIRWVLSPDGSRVILSGTPVRCARER